MVLNIVSTCQLVLKFDEIEIEFSVIHPEIIQESLLLLADCLEAVQVWMSNIKA